MISVEKGVFFSGKIRKKGVFSKFGYVHGMRFGRGTGLYIFRLGYAIIRMVTNVLQCHMGVMASPITDKSTGCLWGCSSCWQKISQLRNFLFEGRHQWPADSSQRTSNALQWRHNGCDGVSNHQPHDCLLNRLFWRRSKKTSKLRVTGLCEGNSPVTGEFPAQRASNAENISIWWRHHAYLLWGQPCHLRPRSAVS